MVLASVKSHCILLVKFGIANPQQLPSVQKLGAALCAEGMQEQVGEG